MNRSFSKARHMQKSNLLLESRLLNEQNDELQKIKTEIQDCAMQSVDLLDMVKYPNVTALILKVASAKLNSQFPGGQVPQPPQITLQDITMAGKDLMKSPEALCPKFTSVVNCVSKKRNIQLPQAITDVSSKFCSTVGGLMKTAKDMFNF